MEDVSKKFLALATLATLAYLYAPGAGAATESPNPIKLIYSGDFDWKGAKLRFDIGASAKVDEGKSRFKATITSLTGETEATCERIPIGTAPFDVNSMTLNCQGRLFGAGKQRMAKFSFADSLSQPKLLLPSGAKHYKEVALLGR